MIATWNDANHRGVLVALDAGEELAGLAGPATLCVPAIAGNAQYDALIAAEIAIGAYAAPAERRLVASSAIVDRLQEAGKLEAARAALDAGDLYTRERWNSRTAIYADDPDALALLAAIGADPETILA